MDSAASITTEKALKLGLVLNHIRQNNVGYLLGVLIAHQLGLLQPVFEYGAGICS